MKPKNERKIKSQLKISKMDSSDSTYDELVSASNTKLSRLESAKKNLKNY